MSELHADLVVGQILSVAKQVGQVVSGLDIKSNLNCPVDLDGKAGPDVKNGPASGVRSDAEAGSHEAAASHAVINHASRRGGSMTRYTYTTCLSFGADGEANYSELDATISYVVRQGRSGAVTAYGHVKAPSEEPEIEDIRVEKIDGHPVWTGDVLTVEAILAKFDTGDHDAALMNAAAVADTDRRGQAA